MQIESARFVRVTELLGEFDYLLESISEDNRAPSWGDNNRTLINKEWMGELITRNVGNYDDETIDSAVVETILLARLRELPDDVYIDMEN